MNVGGKVRLLEVKECKVPKSLREYPCINFVYVTMMSDYK
jgi:hypothetical protein